MSSNTAGGQKAPRALALDALRGFAILTMILSGVIPRGTLPDWMYHAQTPPPTHAFNPNIPGITWVDLVFPFFLFAMGAAIPLAFTKRIRQGSSNLKMTGFIFKRGFLLGAFGIFLQHMRPYVMNPQPTTATWFAAIGGFLLLFLVWGRFPYNWPDKVKKYVIPAIGWIALATVLILWERPDEQTFDFYRSDIIIMILANVSVYGSLVWLFTRKSILLRVGCMGIIMGGVLASQESGWVQYLWTLRSMPGIDPQNVPDWLRWLVQFDWLIKIGTLKYLFIIIPGTIAGDLLLQWMKTLREESPLDSLTWSHQRLWSIVAVMTGFFLVILTGLQSRWIAYTLIGSFSLAGISLYLINNPQSKVELFLHRLIKWGLFWLILGLIFEPFEGGIKKDPVTTGYLFINSALAVFLLGIFTIIIDIFRKKWFTLFITNGQNPMVAYVGWGNLVQPLLNITGIVVFLDRVFPALFSHFISEPWVGTLQGIFYTFLVAIIVHFFTRHKLFLRS